MKKCFLLALMILLGSGIFAQGIKFEKVNLMKAIKLAKKSNKKIFMDIYTEWCGPCKSMSENVFTDKEVGDFYNKHFICLKIDAEKGEGLEIRKQFNVKAFPTLIYLDSSGEVISNEAGSASILKFLQAGQKICGVEITGGDSKAIEASILIAYRDKDYTSICKLLPEYFKSIRGDQIRLGMIGGALIESLLNSTNNKDL